MAVVYDYRMHEREKALALPRALAANDRSALDGLAVDYFELADFEPRVLAAAVRVGSTRLIDNVVLEGETACAFPRASCRCHGSTR